MKSEPKYRIKTSKKHYISSGKVVGIDPSTGELDEDIVEEVKLHRGQNLSGSFMKVNLKAVTIMLGKKLSHSEIAYAFQLASSINKNNVIDFTEIERDMGEDRLNRVRSSLRKAGIIDKIKLDSIPKWYANPYLFAKGHTSDVRLLSFFKPKTHFT